jgi:DNA-directed RNA polymerase subunit N (RpoN/RPB10)
MATFCSSCGNSITADDKFCRVCGRSVSAEWRAFIADAESAADVNQLRRATHTGRPLGSPDFVAGLEELTSRPLAPRNGGRRKKPAADCRQASLISSA